jgi:uncharacterized protein
MNTGATSADDASSQIPTSSSPPWCLVDCPVPSPIWLFCGPFQLVTSPILLHELDEKLRLKFALSADDADRVRSKLESAALVIEPNLALAVITDDPDDDRVLECAVAGRVDYIVSGDRHLLKLGSYQGTSIVTAFDAAKVVPLANADH